MKTQNKNGAQKRGRWLFQILKIKTVEKVVVKMKPVSYGF